MKKNNVEKLNIAFKNTASREDAEEAVRTILKYIGEDPTREGLIETPKRVVKSYAELFKGYTENPAEILNKTFEDVSDYKEMILLKNIEFESVCEHHMLPIIGKAHIAYIPNNRVVGISKLARIVDLYAKRLQIQEKMTSLIAQSIQEYLEPKGVAVMIQASHHCMVTRGVKKNLSTMDTTYFTGDFLDLNAKNSFLSQISAS